MRRPDAEEDARCGPLRTINEPTLHHCTARADRLKVVRPAILLILAHLENEATAIVVPGFVELSPMRSLGYAVERIGLELQREGS